MTLEVEAALCIDIIFTNFRSEAPTCHQGALFEKSGRRGKSGGNIQEIGLKVSVIITIAETFNWVVDSGFAIRTPSGDEEPPKVCCRRTPKFGHSCSQCSSVCGPLLHSGHVGSAAGSRKWANALRSDVCFDRRRARRMASDKLF